MSRSRELIKRSDKSEIPYLIAQGKLDRHTITELLKKYKNNVEAVDDIIQGYTEKIHQIKSKAKKLAKSIIRKAGSFDSLPLHILIKKAQKYKKKLGLNDIEMEEFNRIMFSYISGKQDVMTGLDASNTNIGRFFGTHDPLSRDATIIKDSEFSYMNEILKLYTLTKPIHAAAVVQSLLYEDCSFTAVNGKYDANKHNPACKIDATIAALFLPKLRVIEERMIYANIAHIIKCRYDRIPLNNSPDVSLFHALISDPTDVVCDIDSPLKDLRNRIMIQDGLWQSVIALRNGRYYDCISNQFRAAIENCKVTNYDSSDLVFLGDESTIIRRLFQSFAFRPTIIATIPVYGIYGPGVLNVPVNINKVSSIPIITLRIPIVNQTDDQGVNQNNKIENFIGQSTKFFENNMLVEKSLQILYTNDILIFHIPRRYQKAQWQRLLQPYEPYRFNNTIPSISGFEEVNNYVMDIDLIYNLNSNKEYALRSVVCVETSPLHQNMIIGTNAIIYKKLSEEDATLVAYYYNTSGPILIKDANTPVDPITIIDDDVDIINSRGTLIIYQDTDNYEK